MNHLVNVAADEHQDKPIANLAPTENYFSLSRIYIFSRLSFQEE